VLVTHRTEFAAPDGGTRTRSIVGVGEIVNFSSTVAGAWSADRVGPNHSPTRSGTAFEWQAPSVPGTATITFTPSGAGQAPERTVITVIAPTVEYRNGVRVPSPGERRGAAGVMMHSRVVFGPNTVSFRKAMWVEDPGPPSMRRGYFQTWRPRDHEPERDPIRSDLQNHGPIDEAGYWNLPTTQYDQGGSFEWAIPTSYIIFGESDRHLIRTVHQRFVLGPDGTLTVDKDGQHVSRTP
jgi:hypothetical protein